MVTGFVFSVQQLSLPFYHFFSCFVVRIALDIFVLLVPFVLVAFGAVPLLNMKMTGFFIYYL